MTATQTDNDARLKVISKINKLLAMADPERGATEAEQEQAMARAQKLMFEHRIDLAQVAQADGSEGGVEKRTYTVTRRTKWEATLRYDIIAVFGGKAVRMPMAKGDERWELVASSANLDFMESLCNHLIGWLKHEAKLARKVSQPSNPNAFNRAFYDRASSVIRGRLQQRENDNLRAQREAEDAKGAGTDLVRVDLVAQEAKAVQKFMDDTYAGMLKKTRARGFGNQAGAGHGRDAGQRANLAAGNVGAGGRRQLN